LIRLLSLNCLGEWVLLTSAQLAASCCNCLPIFLQLQNALAAATAGFPDLDRQSINLASKQRACEQARKQDFEIFYHLTGMSQQFQHHCSTMNHSPAQAAEYEMGTFCEHPAFPVLGC
jgi:hypothetical protein